MKKILVVALAVVMLAVMASPVFAAEAETVTCGGWWQAWSKGYEVVDSIELNIKHTSSGTDNWDSIVAIFANVETAGGAINADATNEPNDTEGYQEYYAHRADSYGWTGPLAGANPQYTSTIVDANEDGDTWDDFRGIMADCDINAVVEKTETGVLLTYNVTGANGASFVYTASFDADTSSGLYVFFTGEECTLEITPVEAPVETPDEPSETPDEPTDAPQTGFATIALAIVAIGSGAYIVSKKH